MYKPTGSINLKDITYSQIRLALQGASGTGKTYSALTFPNPVVANFDHNLNAHVGKDITVIPFTDDAYVDSLIPKRTFPIGHAKSIANRRDAFMKWLKTEATKLEAGQTLIIDSWTTLQDSFDKQTDLEPVTTAKGNIDEYAFWARKMDWSRDVLDSLKFLKCHVVVTFHEQYLTDENGKILLNKVAPMMQGKFVNKLGLYFTDWFRCINLIPGDEHPLTKQKVTEKTYLWQTNGGAGSNLKTRMPSNTPLFLNAHYTNIKY